MAVAAVELEPFQALLTRGRVAADALARRHLGSDLADLADKLPSFLRGGLAQSLACYAPPATFAHRGGPALLLVPGLFCTPSVFNRLGRALERLGVDVYLPRPAPLGPGVLANTARVERSAGLLVEDLERLRAQGLRRLSLAGHSLGGLIMLRALQCAQAEGRPVPAVQALIAIASPLRGAPIAGLLRPVVPACRDIAPGAATLAGLEPLLPRVTHTLVSGFDILVPQPSQHAAGAAHHFLPGFQHMDFYVGSDQQVARAARALAACLPAAAPGCRAAGKKQGARRDGQ